MNSRFLKESLIDIGSGKRPNQHYNFLGCPARINLFKVKKSDTFKVTSVDFNHNHEMNSSADPTINDSDHELIMTLRDANVPPSQIRCVLNEKRNKKSKLEKYSKFD